MPKMTVTGTCHAVLLFSFSFGAPIYSGRFYFSVITFPIRHFAGHTKCGGSNQVAVALVKIPFVKMNGSRKNGMLSGGLFYIL